MSGGSWRRRGSRALPHLGRSRRALGRRLGPRSPDTAGQYHEPRWVAGRRLHHRRLHRCGAQVDAESDRRCSHGHRERRRSRRLGGAPSRTLHQGPRRRGGASPANPPATLNVKLFVFPLAEESGAPRSPCSQPNHRQRGGGRRDLKVPRQWRRVPPQDSPCFTLQSSAKFADRRSGLLEPLCP